MNLGINIRLYSSQDCVKQLKNKHKALALGEAYFIKWTRLEPKTAWRPKIHTLFPVALMTVLNN